MTEVETGTSLGRAIDPFASTGRAYVDALVEVRALGPERPRRTLRMVRRGRSGPSARTSTSAST